MQSAKWSLLIEKWSKTNANRWWFTSRAVTNKLFFRQKTAFFRNRTFCSQSIAGIRQNVINHYQVNRQHNTGYYILKVFSSWWEKILTIVRKNTHAYENIFSSKWEDFLITVRILWELNLSESYAYDQGMKLLKEGWMASCHCINFEIYSSLFLLEKRNG